MQRRTILDRSPLTLRQAAGRSAEWFRRTASLLLLALLPTLAAAAAAAGEPVSPAAGRWMATATTSNGDAYTTQFELAVAEDGEVSGSVTLVDLGIEGVVRGRIGEDANQLLLSLSLPIFPEETEVPLRLRVNGTFLTGSGESPDGAPIAIAGVRSSGAVEPAAAPTPVSTITAAYSAADPRVVRYSEHVAVLASPWMEGRLPGTRGMDLAMDYMEWHFRQIGLEPAVPVEGSGGRSFRQPFPLGSTPTISGQVFEIATDDAHEIFELDRDFVLTGLGSGGDVEGPIVFVGYAIESGPEGFTSFREEEDLSGKVALMFRYEPMNDEGASRWSQRGWSAEAGFRRKFNALARRNPAAVILVNPPGVSASLSSGGGSMIEVPVVMATPDAADRLIRLVDLEERGVLEWRRLADEGEPSFEIPEAIARIAGEIREEPVVAENVIGLLPGRGALATEYIVMGGHLDHLGFGAFGSRRGAGQLHPGADDNASGSAGTIMLAEALAERYAALPTDADLRSILFIGFSAEESGLHGARHYVRNPLAPIADHVLMFNFDMIGRIVNQRLRLSGLGSGEGLGEWARGFYGASGLEIVEQEGLGGGSDHRPFAEAGVPVLFSIIADFHDDYHTPDDTADKINREDAMRAVDFFAAMAFDMAQQPRRFEPPTPRSGRIRTPQPLTVRIGMRSRADASGTGLEVVEVTEGGSADAAGIRVGDRVLLWDKDPVNTREELVTKLRAANPGDVVSVTFLREGEEQMVYLTLRGDE